MKNYAKEWKKEIRLKQISYNDFVTMKTTSGIFTPKIDGLLGAFIYQKGAESRLQTSGGHDITQVSVINEYDVLFRDLGVKQAIIIGELAATKAGRVLPFNVSQSVVRTWYNQATQDLIFHYPVDVYMLDNKKVNYREALSFLSKHIGKRGLPHIRMPWIIRGNLDDFRKLYEEIKGKDGYDGVIARRVDGKNYKVKFTESVDLAVIGAGNTEMRAWAKNQISYLVTAFIDKDGFYRASSKVGTGFTQSERAALFRFVNKYSIYDEKNELFLPPQMVIEVKFFRYNITKMPVYRFGNNRYQNMGKDDSIAFSHPTFMRIREDKKPNKFDVRLEQIPEWEY